jgi:hypothetical protein
MKRALEFHDSVVSSVKHEGADVIILLDPAYVHEALQKPAWEPGSCYRQAVELRFFSAHYRNTLPEGGSSELYSGTVQINGVAHEDILPLPFEDRGSTTTSLAYGHLNAVLEVTSDGLRAQAVGPAIWESHFPGAV